MAKNVKPFLQGEKPADKPNGTKKGFKYKYPPHVMQRSFCENIAAGMPKASAARKAGYVEASKQAYLLLKRPAIQEQIEVLRKDLRNSSLITRERVIEGILAAIEQGRLINDPSAMIRGWQELNRMHGYHAPVKLEVDLPDGTKQLLDTLANVPKDKLLELLAEEEESVLEAEQMDDETFVVPEYARVSE